MRTRRMVARARAPGLQQSADGLELSGPGLRPFARGSVHRSVAAPDRRPPQDRYRPARLRARRRPVGQLGQVRCHRSLLASLGNSAGRGAAPGTGHQRPRRPASSALRQFLRRAGADPVRIPGLPAGPGHRRQRAGRTAVGSVRREQGRQSGNSLVDQARRRVPEGVRSAHDRPDRRCHAVQPQRRLLRRPDARSGAALLGTDQPQL